MHFPRNFSCALKAGKPGFYLGLFLFFVAFSLTTLSYINSPSNDHKAYAATSSTINFQARLLNASGNVVPDGNYHIEFKIYDSLAAGSSAQGVCSLDSSSDDCWWRETRTTGNLVRVVNGYFTVNLGSVTAFSSTIPWDQELWLSMNIGGTSGPSWDGEMSPRMKLTAVPYALTAGKLQANSSGITNQLVFATPSASNKTITLPNETGTVCTTGSICSGYQASSTAIIQVPGSTAQNTITPTANSVVALTVNGTSGTAATAVNILQGGAAVALNVTSSNTGNGQTINLTNTSGTQVAGLMIERNGGGGTTTSLLNLTNTAGTVTNGILLSGTVATAIDLSGATSTTDLILDDGLTIAQTSDLDLDLVEGGLTLNVDFGETTGSTITQSTASAFELESSSNTAAALKLEATAGGIDIFASAASAGEDIDIVATGSSINITSTEGAADGIVITSTGGGIDITTTGSAAGEDIDINAGGSSINLTSSEAVADAIVLQASNASGQILFNAGTTDRTADALVLDVDINSASVDGFYIDLDVGTALSAAETANGINIDVTGLAGDNAASFLNGINLNGDVTSAGTVRGLNLSGSFDTGLDLSGAATTTDLILDDGLTIAQTSDLDLDIVEGGLTLNVDFGETTGSTITQAASGAYVLGATSANLTLQTTTSGNIILQAAGTGTTATIQIGAGGAGSTTPDFFALDVKSDTGDPAGGFEGAMYYNTFDNKFRCYQGTGWVDCAGSGGSGITLQGAYDADVDGSDATITLSNEDDSIVISNPNDSANDTDSAFILKVEQLLATGSQETLLIESNGTGNLLRVRDTTATAADVLTIADGGATTFKNQTNSATAFQIQNTAGSSLFTTDTTEGGKIVLLGNTSSGGDLSPWTATSSLFSSTSRTESGTAVANGYVYIVGGADSGGTPVNTVYYAKINSNGTLGTFATSSNTLPSAREGVAVVSANGYLYALGGAATGGEVSQTSVYYAKINTDGSIGSWQTNTNSLTVALQDHGAFVANGYVYVVGGVDASSTTQDEVYYAKLNPDGTTGPWTTNSTVLTQARNDFGLVVVGGYVYVIGGEDTGGGATNTVYYAPLNINGSIGSWTSDADTITAREDIKAVALNGKIYAFGGINGTAQDDVYYTTVASGGGVGAWSTDDDLLPANRQDFMATSSNGYIYLLGGTDGTTPSANVYYASGARVQVGGALDLVGLSNGDLSNPDSLGDGGLGGQLTAGNTKVVGTLEVQGQASFAQNVAISKDLTVGGSISQAFNGPNYSAGVDSTGAVGSGTSVDSTLDVFVVGRYMYTTKAGSATACSQTVSGIGCELQVYDITIPTSPVYVGGADASGTANGGTTSSNFQSIFVAGKYAYITKNASAGCSQTVGSAAGCELQVYDISNPSIPAYVGGADVSGSTNSGSSSATINDVFASGRYLYVVKGADATACSQTAGSAIGCEIQVYDISNPSSPAYVGGVDTTGTANSGTGSSAIVAVTGFGKYITVAKNGDATACSQTAGSAIGCEIQVYDISNPSAPAYVGGADSSGSTNSGTGGTQINTIFISGRYAYVGSGASAASCSQTAGSATGCELKAYSISNPTAPTYVGGADTSGATNSGNTGTVAVTWIYGSGKYIYATRQGDATACSQTPGSGLGCELHVYNVSNPATPMYAAGVDASGSIGSGTGNSGFNIPFVTGRYLFVAKTGDATACSSSVGSALGCEMQVYDITGLEATSIATNTLQAGSLQVSEDGSVYGNFNVQGTLNVGQGASIQGELAVNGANFSIQHLSNNFGTAVEAGAFIDRNSVFTEEWNRDRTDLAADTAAGTPDWGDDTAWRVDESAATTGDCSWAIVDDTVNGIMRTQNDDASSICNAYTGDDGTANDPSLIFDADNLPVILMKVRPSNVGANDDLWVGLQDNSQLVANAEPNNGIFFGNTNGSTWTGTTRSASTSTNVTCTGQTINTGASQFALLKIEVISTSMVKFYVDNDVSNGVRWTYCGASTTNIPTAALASMIKWTSTTITRQLDTDFFRVWQDDNQAQSPEEEQQPEQNAVQSPSVNPQQVGIIDFSEASTSDIVFDNNVYIRGTLFVDEIVANKVIGMEVVTDQISSLQNQLQALLSAQQQQLYQSINSQPGAPSANNLQGNISVSGDLSVSGNLLANQLAVNGLAIFTDINVTGTANFQDIKVNGHIVTAGTQPNVEVLAAVDVGEESQLRPIITIEGNDTSGTITINTVGPQIILPGDLAKIEFSKQFGKKPKVFIEAGNLSAAQLKVHREAALTHFILSNIDQLQPGQIYQFDYFVVE